MKTLRSLWLWTVGGAYTATVFSLVLLLSFILPVEKIDPWLKAAMRGLFRLLRVPVRVKGVEHIAPNRPYLYMANHVSIFDIPLLQGFVPQFVRGVEAAEQFRWPLFGPVIRRMGNIPIEREDIHASIRSMRRALDYLRSGRSLIVLPEGHRTLDGRLRPFKKLPFHLAKQAGVDLVPVGLSGLYTLKRKGHWHIQPHPLTIRFGKPIPAETIRTLSVEALRNRVRQEIERLVEFP